MSRLQEYLRTPTPTYRQFFFTPKSCHQSHNLFAQEEGQHTKGLQEFNIPSKDTLQRMGEQLPRICSSQLSFVVPKFQQNIIQLKLDFENQNHDQMITPISKVEKDRGFLTTAQKKYDLRTSGNLMPNFSDNRQCERTLRVLAAQAYNIVFQKGSTTYRQVSQAIISDSSDIPSSKEQKNIKRRVYDALNVLIALGKLEKRGRGILQKKSPQKQRLKRDQLVELKKSLEQKQAIVIEKQKFYKSELKKNQNLKKLVERNKRIGRQGNEDKIVMPFLLTTYEMNMCEQRPEVQIIVNRSKNNGGMVGDMDVLEFLKFKKEK